MAIRDYWVYQKRQADVPWALYIVKEYDKRKGMSATVLDWTIYSENIELSTHSKSRVGVHEKSIEGYVNELICDLVEISTITDEDVRQLNKAIEDILLD